MSYVLDLILILLLGYGAVQSYQKGFIVSALGFLPMLVALVATRILTPTVSQFLRQTPFFESFSKAIENGLQLEQVIGQSAMQTQTEMIQSMQLPNFLKDALLEHNNPVIYNLLDVESLQSYIAGFLANICLNIMSVFLVFVVVLIGMHVLLHAMNLVSKMPVLNFCNKVSGLVVGLVKSLCMIWLLGFILTFFQCNAKFTEVFMVIESSVVAKFLYEHNILMTFVLTLFA